MAYSFWDNVQIREIPGRKKVTEDQKNALIERAVSTWKSMGLTDPQIAFATTVMGHKSGFDANAQGAADGSHGYGLGQFTDDAWEDAVNRYNDNYEPGIDAVEHRKDPDAQIRVMGAWVPHAWDKAGEIAGDPNVKGYNQAQIAYGTWNQGPDADAKDVGTYLKGNWHDPDTGGYFDTTYDRAMQGLSLRKDYLSPPGQEEEGQSDGSVQNWMGYGHEAAQNAQTGTYVGEDTAVGQNPYLNVAKATDLRGAPTLKECKILNVHILENETPIAAVGGQGPAGPDATGFYCLCEYRPYGSWKVCTYSDGSITSEEIPSIWNPTLSCVEAAGGGPSCSKFVWTEKGGPLLKGLVNGPPPKGVPY
jgi:hypothetical protein